jgi:thiol-disulfide isomerase/thioredoxin
MFRFFLPQIVSLAVNSVEKYRARGLPEEIEWHSYVAVLATSDVFRLEEAKVLSQENHKPILVIFTKSWCPACDTLKSKLNGAPGSLFEAAKAFNVVSIEEDDEVRTGWQRSHSPRTL